MKTYLLALALLVSVLAGCTSNPVNTARGNYYAIDAKVTAVDAAVLTYVSYPDCVQTGNVLPCSKASARVRLAQATKALGTAMDQYSATVRDPNFTQGGITAASIAVNNALLAVTAILAELGVNAP